MTLSITLHLKQLTGRHYSERFDYSLIPSLGAKKAAKGASMTKHLHGPTFFQILDKIHTLEQIFNIRIHNTLIIKIQISGMRFART